MGEIGVAAVAGHFGRDLEACLSRVEAIVSDAHEAGCDLVVFPDASLGGYLPRLGPVDDTAGLEADDLPPALSIESDEIERLRKIAGDLTICVGFCEADGSARYNTAVCVSGDGILGRHRKVHQPEGEKAAYSPGDSFEPFDTPVGRMGMLIDYDKTFPESARALAGGGAEILAFLSAWPASLTNRAPRLAVDRQTRLFDLYDYARAAENQVIVVSSNQTGRYGRLTFLGRAKVVGPGGDRRGPSTHGAALVTTRLDVRREIDRARGVLHHLTERRPDAYGVHDHEGARPTAGA